MHILVAPDKFKGTLDAPSAARAIELGARRVFPHAEIELLPLADGGEGTLDVLVAARGGTIEHVPTSGPLGERVTARIARLTGGPVVVAMSEASGLPGARRRLDPLHATSRGTGELVVQALQRLVAPSDPAEVLLCIGGSASTDGGTGAATAIGWRFKDALGYDLPYGGAPLRRLSAIVHEGPALGRVTVTAACDVSAPLLGHDGAARRFAAQKGATPDDIDVLEESMARLAERIVLDVGNDVANVPGAGAGGGMGAGVLAFFNGALRAGFDVVAEMTGFAGALMRADLVVTAEGRLDRGTLMGKAPARVAGAARRAGIPCGVVAGQVSVEPEALHAAGFSAFREVTARGATPDAAVAQSAEGLLREFA